MGTMKHAKLIMVTGHSNHNKFYNLTENDNDTFTAEWGRVGVTSTKKTYPMSTWLSKYKSKIKKGYQDNTHLFTKSTTKSTLKDITHNEIKLLMDNLQNYSNTSLANSYQVSSDSVTQKQIDEAQKLMNKLALLIPKRKKLNIETKELNESLLELFKVIPRKLKKVKNSLFEDKIDKDTILKKLDEEQSILDNMASKVSITQQQKDTNTDDKTILDMLGITVEDITANEEQDIKQLMTNSANRFVKAFRVNHHNSRNKMDKYCTDNKITNFESLYHGSKNLSWIHILKSSLLLRPTNGIVTGALLGSGLYFANKAQKSIGYTSVRGSYWVNGTDDKGYLAIFEVGLGKELITKNHTNWMYDLTLDNLKKQGNYDSFYFIGGPNSYLQNDEKVVYHENQCTIKYLIEIK